MSGNYGLRSGLSYEKYSEIRAVNRSLLEKMMRSPAHAREYMLNPQEPTAAQKIGQAVHVAILEPEKFQAEYAVAPPIDRRTKAGKEAWDAFRASSGSRIILDNDEAALCEALRTSVKDHPEASKIVASRGTCESVACWRDGATGLDCKARIDLYCDFAGSTVVELKTTRDASPEGFSREISRYGYHRQAAYYLGGLEALSPATDRKFIFIAVEKEPPYAVGVYELDESSIEQGRVEIECLLSSYAKCVQEGVWPGYSPTIRPIGIPKWAFGDYTAAMRSGELAPVGAESEEV